MGITDSNGNFIAQYSYDEWGKVTAVTATEGNLDIANINPLRYRGYYYDAETDYYYLQSRYYGPNICRFINADLPEYAQIQKNDVSGVNIFAYCCNDAVNYSDALGFYRYAIYRYRPVDTRRARMLIKRYQLKVSCTKGGGRYFNGKRTTYYYSIRIDSTYGGLKKLLQDVSTFVTVAAFCCEQYTIGVVSFAFTFTPYFLENKKNSTRVRLTISFKSKWKNGPYYFYSVSGREL